MRIELNSGGISGLVAISVYEADMITTSNRIDDMISAFTAVKKAANNLNGGTNGVEDALNSLQCRINYEQNKRNSLDTILKETSNFLSDAIKLDKQVAEMIKDSKEEFYKVNPWAKPTSDREGWDWFIHAVDDILDDMANALDDAWDAIVEWYEYGGGKELLSQIMTIASVALAIANVVLDIVLLVPPLTAMGIAKIALEVAAVVVVIADGGLDIFNEEKAKNLKKQALEAEKRGDYTEAARLRKEAAASSSENTWRDKWWNDGETNGWDLLGVLMGGIELADMLVGFDVTNSYDESISVLDVDGSVLSEFKFLGQDITPSFKGSSITNTFKNFKNGFSIKNFDHMSDLFSAGSFTLGSIGQIGNFADFVGSDFGKSIFGSNNWSSDNPFNNLFGNDYFNFFVNSGDNVYSIINTAKEISKYIKSIH